MPRKLDAQHDEIATELKERAEIALTRLIGGQLAGMRLDDHAGRPAGPMCGLHIGPFGPKIRYVAHKGASGIYLDPKEADPAMKNLILRDLNRQIDNLLSCRQTFDPRSNRWPELVTYTHEEILRANAESVKARKAEQVS